MARRRFFVDAVHSGRARISGVDAQHLTRVLRVQPGQQFEISDNRNVYLAEVQSARKDGVDFAILRQMEALAPAVHVTLFAALIKFERFEWLLEKATELGVERIVPVETERSEKGLAQAAGKRLARWNRIAQWDWLVKRLNLRLHKPDGPSGSVSVAQPPLRLDFTGTVSWGSPPADGTTEERLAWLEACMTDADGQLRRIGREMK